MDTPSTIRERTISGFKWNVIGQILMYITSFTGTVVLSRLLDPHDFGLLGMLTVMTSFGTLVVGLGLAHAVVQNQALTKEDFSSIFWLNLILGFMIALIFFLASGAIARFYNEPDLLIISRWFSIIFVVHGCSSVTVGLLSRKMDFRSLVTSQFISALVSTVIAILLALNNFGVWCLIAQALSSQVVYVMLNFWFSGWRPTFVFKKATVAKISKFTRNFLPNQMIDFFASNIDIMIIGKRFGTIDLGFYSRAGALVMLPVNSLGVIYNKTFFSTFASLQQYPKELERSYLKSAKLLLLTLFPILIIIGIGASDIVNILFGPKWVDISPLVAILAIAAAISTINNFNDSFIVSQGRTDLLLRVNIAEKLILVVAIFIGAYYGLIGVAYAKISALALTFIPRAILLAKTGTISKSAWFRTQGPLLLIFTTSYIVGSFGSLLAEGLSEFFRLMVVIISVLSVILGSLFVIKDPLLAEALVYIKMTASKKEWFKAVKNQGYK
jgi:O-antigen/teichoic acid export membrane protein